MPGRGVVQQSTTRPLGTLPGNYRLKVELYEVPVCTHTHLTPLSRTLSHPSHTPLTPLSRTLSHPSQPESSVPVSCLLHTFSIE